MPRAPKFTPVAAVRLAPSPPNLYAGTSGWAYPTWKPGFYPAEVPVRGFLHEYGARLTSVEVNYTFSKLCTEPQLREWMDATPPGFRFSFKAPQGITHFKRLKACRKSVEAFVASLEPARAAGKFGAVLFQLPPNFKVDTRRLKALLALSVLKDPELKVAFEFRHESWFAEPVYEILRRHNAALCIAESDKLVTPDVATADFRYYRLRRDGGYSAQNLKIFSERFEAESRTREVFAYFKHEDEPTGALNAVAMLKAAAKLSAKAGS